MLSFVHSAVVRVLRIGGQLLLVLALCVFALAVFVGVPALIYEFCLAPLPLGARMYLVLGLLLAVLALEHQIMIEPRFRRSASRKAL